MGPASASSSRPASADASNAAQEPHLLQLQYASQVGHKGSAGGSASQVLSNLAAPGSPGSPGSPANACAKRIQKVPIETEWAYVDMRACMRRRSHMGGRSLTG
eukprot:gene20917-27765_t